MNGIYSDPVLRQEIDQQHHQRLIDETNKTRLIKSLSTEEAKDIERGRFIPLLSISALIDRVSQAGKALLIALGVRNESFSA